MDEHFIFVIITIILGPVYLFCCFLISITPSSTPEKVTFNRKIECRLIIGLLRAKPIAQVQARHQKKQFRDRVF